MMNIGWMRNGRLGSALLCLFALVVSAKAQAQSEPAETIPQPPPSIEEFSLPPGSSTPTPQPGPTGPIDESAPVTPDPPPTTPAEPATEPEDTENPADQPAPAPVVASDPAAQPDRVQIPSASVPQARPTLRQATPETSQQPEPAIPVTDSDSAVKTPEESGETLEPPPTNSVEVPESRSIDQSATTVEETINWTIPLLVIAGLLLAMIAAFFWQRRTKQLRPDSPDNKVSDSNVPLSETSKPTPEISESKTSEFAHDGKKKLVSASDGFVTTKIQKIDTPARQEPVPAAKSDQLHIEFQAESASSTLVNAIVSYRIIIENRSDQPIENLRISGTMIQADHKIVETAAASQGQLLHEIANLKVGQSETMSGDIRLPLAAFQPIEFQSQKLFVPLVLLRFDHEDSSGNHHMQAANYLIGTEHVPPRDKMAPFRLDLGPRNFGDVAHRPFQS